MATLITTTATGAETRTENIHHGPRLMIKVADLLSTTAPWLDSHEARRLGLQVARSGYGTTTVHTGTGLRFRIELDPPQELTA
jgi:hypothetical protein